MDQPNTTAWCIAVCTATGNFFTYWTPCSCGWKTPCFSCNTDHLNIAISYIFPDTGLALGQTCQSGIWSTAAGKPKLSTFTLTHYGRSFHYSNVGIHDLCTSQYGNENNRDDSWRGVQLLGDGSWQIVVKDGSETIMCLDW